MTLLKRISVAATVALLLVLLAACAGSGRNQLIKRPTTPVGKTRVLPLPATTPTPAATFGPTPTPAPTPVATPPPAPPPPLEEPPAAAVVEEPPPPPPAPAPPPAPPAPPGYYMNATLARDLINRINGERTARGLNPLSADSALMRTAEDYAQLHRTFADPLALSHYLAGSPGDRAAQHGYGGLVGEVLASGPPDGATLMNLWMNSPSHYSILMDGSYSEIGVGCWQGPYTDARGYTFDIALCAGETGTGG